MADFLLVTRMTDPGATGKLWLPNNRQLTPAEVRGLAAIYWPPNQVENAYLVANCESGCWTGAWAHVGEDSRGLWQLNVQAHLTMEDYALEDPQINAYWAYWLWSNQGWAPWTCAHLLHIV